MWCRMLSAVLLIAVVSVPINAQVSDDSITALVSGTVAEWEVVHLSKGTVDRRDGIKGDVVAYGAYDEKSVVIAANDTGSTRIVLWDLSQGKPTAEQGIKDVIIVARMTGPARTLIADTNTKSVYFCGMRLKPPLGAALYKVDMTTGKTSTFELPKDASWDFTAVMSGALGSYGGDAGFTIFRLKGEKFRTVINRTSVPPSRSVYVPHFGIVRYTDGGLYMQVADAKLEPVLDAEVGMVKKNIIALEAIDGADGAKMIALVGSGDRPHGPSDKCVFIDPKARKITKEIELPFRANRLRAVSKGFVAVDEFERKLVRFDARGTQLGAVGVLPGTKRMEIIPIE